MTVQIGVIVTSVLASITTTSVLGVVLQELIKRWMNSKFDREIEAIKSRNAQELAAVNAELEGQRETLKRLAQVRLETFPSICESLYRAKNELAHAMRQFPTAQSRQDARAREDLRLLAGKHGDSVSEACFKYRFLLTNAQFSLIHQYKDDIQALSTIIAVDEQTGNRELTVTSLLALERKLTEQLPAVIAALQADEPLFRPSRSGPLGAGEDACSP